MAACLGSRHKWKLRQRIKQPWREKLKDIILDYAIIQQPNIQQTLIRTTVGYGYEDNLPPLWHWRQQSQTIRGCTRRNSSTPSLLQP
jgi:hypothetical protein